MRAPRRRTLTATSADDGYGEWVVRVVVGRAEGVAEGIDGLTLEAESYVGVDAGGDADVGVAQQLFDDDEVDALFQEQGRGRVPQVVEADASEPGLVEEAAEAAGEVGWVDPARTAAYARAITDKDVTKVGTEEIDGANTTQYKVSVDVSKLPGGEQLSKQVGPTLPMQIWLDDEGRLRRQQIEMSVKAPVSASAKPEGSASPQQLKMSTVMEFSDFGTEVNAEAPPAGQVADMTDQSLQGSQQHS